eukprot:gene6953-14114_t
MSLQKVENVVEQDTDDSEEIPNMLEFLIPHGDIFSTGASQFGISGNRSLIDGWVKQPSPCCAAASLAGAWNALAGLHRKDERALNHNHILVVYKKIFQAHIVSKTESFERLLGASIDTLIDQIETELSKEGRIIGGKPPVAGASKSSVIKAVKRLAIARENQEKKENRFESHELNFLPRPIDPLLCLFELMKGDLDSLETDVQPAVEGDGDKLEEAEEDGEIGDEEGDATAVSVPNRRGSTMKTRVWDWRKDLMEIINKMAGLRRLEASKPSTAPIGNWGILAAVIDINDGCGFGDGVTARLLMGRKNGPRTKVDVPLLLKDRESAEYIQKHWEALRTAFNTPGTILLFHLRNHYALIFALREWVSSSGYTRQLLTARRGQRPSAWIEFQEARETMYVWAGYKIIALTTNLNVTELRETKSRLLGSFMAAKTF